MNEIKILTTHLPSYKVSFYWALEILMTNYSAKFHSFKNPFTFGKRMENLTENYNQPIYFFIFVTRIDEENWWGNFLPIFLSYRLLFLKDEGGSCQTAARGPHSMALQFPHSLPFPATQGMRYKNSAMNSLHFSPRKSREEAFFESFRLVLGRCVEQSNHLGLHLTTPLTQTRSYRAG